MSDSNIKSVLSTYAAPRLQAQAMEESWSRDFVPSISRESLGYRDRSGEVRNDEGEKDSESQEGGSGRRELIQSSPMFEQRTELNRSHRKESGL